MPAITDFVDRSDTVLLDLMTALEKPLELPHGTFAKLHNREQISGSEVRVISKPAPGERGFLAEGNAADGGKSASIGVRSFDFDFRLGS